MNRKCAGRKLNSDISNEDMITWIQEYTKVYPNEEIKMTKLSKLSNIPRHYWYYRKEIKKYIDKINKVNYEELESNLLLEDRNILRLPNIDELVDNNFGSKKRLKKALEMYFNLIQTLFDSSLTQKNIEKKLYNTSVRLEAAEKELKKLKEKNNSLEEQIKHYKNLYYERAIKSRDKNYREENKIESAIIRIDKSNKNRYSTKDSDLDSLINKL